MRGLMYVVAGVLEIPRATVAGTFGGPPVIGTVFGAINGTVRGVGMVARGAIETVTSVAGLALKYGPIIPIFL